MRNTKNNRKALTSNMRCQTNVFVKMFFIISLLILSKNVLANDSLGIAFDKVLLFESGKETPAKQDRIYINYFQPEARYINIELNFKNLKYQIADQEYQVSFVWKYLNGDEFGRSETQLFVKSDLESAYFHKGLGWEDKGNWPLGRFTSQIFINGTLFAEKDFFINLDDMEFILLPEANSDIMNLQQLPESISYQILQQYKIDPYFNYFDGYKFSQDGGDIAYRMSHIKYSDSSNLVTRNMYLFRNNKQILPVYFTLHPYFDNNLENLVYLGGRVRNDGNLSSTDYNCYYNGGIVYYDNQIIYLRPQYHDNQFIYISPDGKNYACVSGDYDNSSIIFKFYKYLMINQQKVQPEWLTEAKTIYINEPIVYIKNQDHSYDVVYTAEYKIDNQTHFALFNEAKRVSPQFDGDIGLPHVSADKNNVAYIVKDNKEWFVMINDQRITKEYDKIEEEIVFCESGRNILYKAKIKGDWYVMKGDEKVSDGFSEIRSIEISPNEDRIAYKAKSGKKWSVYIDNRKMSSEFDDIGEEIKFSPDGNNVAYAASIGDSMFIMLNDTQISLNIKIYQHPGSKIFEQGPLALTNLTFNKAGDKVAFLIGSYFDNKIDDIHKMSPETDDRIFYIMINDFKVSPQMYGASMISNKAGELIYAGVSISDSILYHVKIDF